MIIINLATIDFGGGGSSKPLKTEPLIANVWSRGRRVFSPTNYNVDGFSDVTINTAVIGENSALDFSLIGWDSTEGDDINAMYNADIEYSKSVLDKWNNDEISDFQSDSKLIYCPKVDTSNVTNMNYMFYYCTSLTTIPQLDTSNVTDMSYMFSSCPKLTSIPLLNTQNVTNMKYMFSNCPKLTSIPLLNTQNVTNMATMFGYCSSLTTIPLLDTSNVTIMSSMFSNCPKLTSIPLLDTQNVTDMATMFSNCSSLTTISLLNTQNVTNMSYMFYDCTSLTTIPQLNTSNVTNMNGIFYQCTSLQSLPLLNCANVTIINDFFGYSTISTLTELGGFKDLKINWSDNNGLAKLPSLTYQSIMNVLNNLYDFRANGDMSTTKTIKLNSNSYNLLSAEDIAMANNKGWNITK